MPAEKNEYKATLNLPKTDFAMKADLPTREPARLEQWETARLYEQVQKAREGRPKFVLHDGPPYANGDIHIGHALNKIIKDIIVRVKTMQGFASPYVPGWDCHGMPIEHQLLKELGITKHQIAQTEFRQKAKEYAQRWVDTQREQFKRLGVAGDWPHPYLTMDREYELTIIRVFKELVGAGRIYHGRKPVLWCPNCETALADAEVEYEDRQDTSIDVKFEVSSDSLRIYDPEFAGARKLFFVIWTTTPWTLPANVAVALHPEQPYRLVEVGADELWIIADALVDRVLARAGVASARPTNRTLLGRQLHDAGLSYQRPFNDAPGRVVTDEFVSMDDGTGIVHIAPGHGEQDYAIGMRNGLDLLSPVNEQGRFTRDVPQWAGLTVKDANPKIVDDLRARGLLVAQQPITHSYPHCWRCKQPVIFRATSQWFLRVDAKLRERLLQSTAEVRWTPPAGKSRMRGMLETRPDWCLSRQRYWGTPIPILYCVPCGKPLATAEVIGVIERALRERGVEAWFSAPATELAPGVKCPDCNGREFRKETDILDVWFDSGVSHEAVLKTRPELTWPADLYLEGSDQHRGWFQVSLITSVSLHDKPPYRGVLTHGFVLDGEGRKMSKSLGNVIAPKDVIQRYGADILRLWVASSDHSEDVRISDSILERVAEAYRKIRNTFRYLLANVSDFRLEHRQPIESMPEIDRWAVWRADAVVREVTASYEAAAFHQVFRTIYQFCVLDLSSFYLDALKDRLYTEPANSNPRRCAQTTLYVILERLVRLVAPILAMTADEVWDVMRATGLADEASVHLAVWPKPAAADVDEAFKTRWQTLLAVRDVVMKELEAKRAANVIGSPLEARVELEAAQPVLTELQALGEATLAEAFVVSQVTLKPGGKGPSTSPVPGLYAAVVERADGAKCQRCWKHLPSVGESAEHPQLCARCVAAVGTLANQK